MSNLAVVLNEVQAVVLPCGGCVIVEQAAGEAEGRYQLKVSITVPDTVDLALRVNGEVLLLGDE